MTLLFLLKFLKFRTFRFTICELVSETRFLISRRSPQNQISKGSTTQRLQAHIRL